MSLVHLSFEELVYLFKSLALSWELFLDVRSCEDILQIDPLLLTYHPFLDNLVECEEVLLPGLSLVPQWLDIARTKDHVNACHSFVQCCEDLVNLV